MYMYGLKTDKKLQYLAHSWFYKLRWLQRNLRTFLLQYEVESAELQLTEEQIEGKMVITDKCTCHEPCPICFLINQTALT